MLRFPPKSVLVPVDLSETSLSALAQARAFDPRPSIECLYVEEPPPVEALPYYWETIRDPRYKKSLAARLRQAVGPEPRLQMRVGDPAAEILALARTRKPDLLVMGTHGRSGIARLFMGSVTEAVVARSSVPVLALRQPARRIRRVLAPVNFADYSDAGLVYAAALAAALRARLTALYVREAGANDGDPLLRLNERLLRLPGKPALPEAPAAKVRQGHPAAEIAREAVEHDLVVLTAHSKGLLRDALLGTTVERVLRASPAPVLAVPSVGPRRTSPPPLLEAVA